MGRGALVVCCVAAACGDNLPGEQSPAPNACEGYEPPAVEDVWAIGDGGALWHFDGDAWTATTPVTTHDLHAIWGTAPDDVWVVGDAGTILHRTGEGWSEVASGTGVALRDVAGSGPDDVWAVGDGGTILHWDGDAWAAVAAGTEERLLAVWVEGPDRAFIGGPVGAVLEWDGQSWTTTVVSTRPVAILALDGLSADDLWAVGVETCVDCYTDECLDCNDDVVMRRDGDGWHEDSILVMGDSGVSSIAAFADGVWATVDSYCQYLPDSILRLEGGVWTVEHESDGPLRALWGPRPDALLAGGDTVVSRGDSSWKLASGVGPVNDLWGAPLEDSPCTPATTALPTSEVEGFQISPCRGVDCGGGLCDSLYADGACVEGDDGCRTTVCACDGDLVAHDDLGCGQLPPDDGPCSDDEWCIVAPLPVARVTALWATAPDVVWVGGRDGVVARRTLSGWERLDLGIAETVTDIAGTAADDVWFMAATALYHWDGTSLAEVDVDCRFGSHGDLMYRYDAIEVTASGEVWVSGDRSIFASAQDSAGACWLDADGWHAARDESAWGTPWGECGGSILYGCRPFWSSGNDLMCGGYGWDGEHFVVIDGFPVQPGAVWGSLGDAWVVVEDVLWHWNGDALEPTGVSGVTAIDGATPEDVWAVGTAGVLHWDGDSWDPVSDTSASFVAAIGDDQAMVASGGQYQLSTLLVHVTLDAETDEHVGSGGRAVWTAGSDEIWVVGYAADSVSRWDGETWADLPVTGYAYDVLGFAPDDVWVVGEVVAHYDGAWTVVPAVDLDFGYVVTDRHVSRLAGVSSDDLWAVGWQKRDGDDEPWIAHRDGGGWSVASYPGDNYASEIWTAGDDVWLASEDLVYRWNGVAWQAFDMGFGVFALFGFSDDDVWAAGLDGATSHWNGTAWDAVTIDPDDEHHLSMIEALWGTSSDDLWAVGRTFTDPEDGFILHWDGDAWSPRTSPARGQLNDLHGSGGLFWAVGEYLLQHDPTP